MFDLWPSINNFNRLSRGHRDKGEVRQLRRGKKQRCFHNCMTTPLWIQTILFGGCWYTVVLFVSGLHYLQSSTVLPSMATNSSLTPCALWSNLSNTSTFSAFFHHTGILYETFDSDSKGKSHQTVNQRGTNVCYVPQEQSIWILQYNCMLKHRLYEIPDVQPQTYKPQPSNKKNI